MSAQTAGYFRDPDGVMRVRCACGHTPHYTDTCTIGVVTGREQTEGPCGCRLTCPRCLNMRFFVLRSREDSDDTWVLDCTNCTDGTGAA